MYYARKELFSILIEVLKSDEKCFETLKSFILVVKYIKKHCMFLMRWGGELGVDSYVSMLGTLLLTREGGIKSRKILLT